MKTLLLLLATTALVGTAFNKGGVERKLSTGEGLALADEIHEIIGESGQYIKQTDICLNEAAQDEACEYFHAGYYSLQRLTFYDETADALLMSNIVEEGVDLFETINSGYGKSGDDMVHFEFKPASEEEEFDYFDSGNWDVDYKVKNTSPKEYFVMLSSIESELRSVAYELSYKNGTYTYNVEHLTHDENGYYSDKLLHKVQYFAAPLLLESVAGQEDYLSPSAIEFTVSSDELMITVLVSDSDEGKIDNENNILAIATVNPGLYL